MSAKRSKDDVFDPEVWQRGFAAGLKARAGASDGVPFGIVDPDYGRVYTLARLMAWQEGYALALHGSFTRDLDLVAVPWTDAACDPDHLVKRITDATKLTPNGAPSFKPFGRLTWTLVFPEFGDPRFVDLSVMPRAKQPTGDSQ